MSVFFRVLFTCFSASNCFWEQRRSSGSHRSLGRSHVQGYCQDCKSVCSNDSFSVILLSQPINSLDSNGWVVSCLSVLLCISCNSTFLLRCIVKIHKWCKMKSIFFVSVFTFWFSPSSFFLLAIAILAAVNNSLSFHQCFIRETPAHACKNS